MTREVKIKGMTFTITTAINGRLWQEVQKLTGRLHKGIIDDVDYNNLAIKLFVVKLVYKVNEEERTVTNVEEILKLALDGDIDIIDTLSTEVAKTLEENPYIKKKLS